MTGVRIPRWLRRALEAAVVAALVATGNLVGARMTAGAEIWALPTGVAGALVLAPSVLALSVLPAAYPAAMAATRSDSIFGAIVAFLLAADVVAILASAPVVVGQSGSVIAGGLVAVLVALPGVVAGTIAGQLAAPLGFGRRSGGWAALLAAVGGAVALVLLVSLA